MAEGKRAFRSPESLAAESRTRDRVLEYLAERGFKDIVETRTSKSQILAVTDPSGNRLKLRVRLCWHWGGTRGNRMRAYSGWQVTKEIGPDGFVPTLDRWVERNRKSEVTHVLLLQANDDAIQMAALIPLGELPPMWQEQHGVSQREIDAGRTKGVRRNHCENGDSPTLWLKDDRSDGGRAVSAAFWAWPGIIDLFSLAAPVDDTYDDLPPTDPALLGGENAPRKQTTRSEVKRDPRVRKAVADRATSGCERPSCGDTRRYPGFLDVHHILGAEKSDREWTCVALCPNCHREAHFSPERDKLNEELLEYARRFAPATLKAA